MPTTMTDPKPRPNRIRAEGIYMALRRNGFLELGMRNPREDALGYIEQVLDRYDRLAQLATIIGDRVGVSQSVDLYGDWAVGRTQAYPQPTISMPDWVWQEND